MESVAIITYGSLLDPDELAEAYDDVSYIPIKLDGYRRHFAQRASWRRGENGEDCVSTVSHSESDWISALLITGLTEEEYDEYTEREEGYEIETVDADAISFYNEEWDLEQFEEILIPIGDKPVPEEDINPIPNYVRLCTEGAFEHGVEFGSDFVLTTHRTP